jgi:hypothetical protein
VFGGQIGSPGGGLRRRARQAVASSRT